MQTQTHTLPRLTEEFGSYEVETLPPIPAHWEDISWHNDACPSFLVTPSLCVFLDYADPAHSDFPEWRASGELKRFSIAPMEDEQHINSDRAQELGLPENFHSDDWNEVLAALIGETFAANLREILSDAQWQAMQRINSAFNELDTCCASHNFCDANMPMSDAFETVMGREVLQAPDGSEEHESDCRLWNAAWQYATERHLRGAAAPAGCDRGGN